MVKYHDWQTKEWNECKRKNRLDMAKTYKLFRKENPAIARLLFKRIKQCEKELELKLYGTQT